MADFLAACQTGNIESLTGHLSTIKDQEMLQKGLRDAIEAGQIAAVALLFEHGVPIERMSFIWAARAESQEVWQCFIDHGFDLNNLEFGSALRLSTGDPALVKWLLEHGADPNLQVRSGPSNTWQTNALKTALAMNELESARVLIAHGARLESSLFEGCVSLTHGNMVKVEVLQFLLDSGLDPNVVIENGRGTPLQLAVRRGRLDKAKTLLQAGASMDVQNSEGETPLEEASKARNEAMIALLSSFSR